MKWGALGVAVLVVVGVAIAFDGSSDVNGDDVAIEEAAPPRVATSSSQSRTPSGDIPDSWFGEGDEAGGESGDAVQEVPNVIDDSEVSTEGYDPTPMQEAPAIQGPDEGEIVSVQPRRSDPGPDGLVAPAGPDTFRLPGD